MRRGLRIVLFATIVLLCGVGGFWAPTIGSPPTAPENLLINPGAEAGTPDQPAGWRPITLSAVGGDVTFAWDERTAHTGERSLRIDANARARGIWSQSVCVVAGTVYQISGYVAFEDLLPQTNACLQVVFRDADGALLERVDLARHHSGSRGFDLDFPARMLVRAPEGAVRAEVNGFLDGAGSLWIDDVSFSPAPVGSIVGRVTSAGGPVEGARVWIWGDPWGQEISAVTDADGFYALNGIPVSHPRYIVMVEKRGYRSVPAGDVDVVANMSVRLDVALDVGTDPTDTLEVGYGSIARALVQEQLDVPEYAPLPSDPTEYPDSLRPYLGSDAYITVDDPVLRALAADILATVAETDRDNAVAVAWAVFSWISTHINHDAVYGNAQPYLDVTSGIWQTIQPGGWCWGRNLYDWLYRPTELLEEGTGICIEHSWLSAAVLRALNIPARARVGSAQFWIFLDGGDGAWFGFSTNGGSNAYRETGDLGTGFGGSTLPTFFSASSEPFLQEDWDWEQPGLWRERHPWGEVYPAGEEGLLLARRDLAAYAESGVAAAGPGRRQPGEGAVEINYSQIELNLWNLGEQRRMDVRFPGPTESSGTIDTGEWAYWTNHPECVVETYAEVLSDSPTGIVQTWRHIVFDVSSLFPD